MFSTDDTIVAIATPPGTGALGVVRLSGPRAHEIALHLMARHTPLVPRRATFGRIIDRSPSRAAAPVDQVVATRYVAPQSFTGDDVVEISGHGSMFLLRQVTSMAVHAGARLAEPGEFTFRAFVNGRLDLVQAEAVRDLVDAVTPLQARSAMDQLEGTLTGAIGRVDAVLFDVIARLEASLDFPDEGFHFVEPAQAAGELTGVVQSIDRLLRDGRAGRVIREGSLVVLCGRPNAGKSSLFNALVGASRAIVTEMAGTTRDLLTERVDLDGLPVTLVDTAGLRDAMDTIEAEGVRRAREAQQVAALTLFVVDGSAALAADDEAAIASLRSPCVVVVSKIDLGERWRRPAAWDDADVVRVSSVTGDGLGELRREIGRRLTDTDVWRDPPAVSNLRHLTHLEEARTAILRAVESLQSGASEELVLADLTPAREALECVTGRRAPDDLLHHIFARFCLGK